MANQFHFFDVETGLLHEKCVVLNVQSADVQTVARANAPAGHEPIEGAYDHLSQRVDVPSGKVVDYQPPQPSTDHEWNHVTKRWDLNQAALERLHLANEKRLRLAVLTAKKPDLVSDALLGKEGAMDKLRVADNEIELLKEQLNANL